MTDDRQNQYQMRDPRSLYPAPPYPDQPQDKPGWTEKMEPRPDHGEETYRGAGRLEGRRALITGGDSGLGRAAAIAYSREGAVVTINYLEPEEEDAQSLKALIEDEGGTLHLMPGDLKDENFARGLVHKAAEAMGGLDILVCNAAKQVFQEGVGDISSEQFDHTMKTNIYATFWMNQEALKLMPPGATIINVTSVQGFDPSPTLLDYATTKFAIRGFTQGLAPTAMKSGIRVNGIAPRAVLDAAAALGRAEPREGAGVRQAVAHRPPRPAGRAGAGLRVPGLGRVELHDRRDPERHRRRADDLAETYAPGGQSGHSVQKNVRGLDRTCAAQPPGAGTSRPATQVARTARSSPIMIVGKSAPHRSSARAARWAMAGVEPRSSTTRSAARPGASRPIRSSILSARAAPAVASHISSAGCSARPRSCPTS